MGLNGIGYNSSAAAIGAASPDPGQASGGGLASALGFGTQTTAAGGMIAQGPGSSGSILKKVLIGGAAGAALGFGASFFTLPIIGQIGAPIAAAVGGGIGALAGLALGLFQKRKENLALQAQQQSQGIAPGAGTQPVSVPRPLAGKVHKVGSSGPTVRWTQKALTQLGMFKGSLTGKLDEPTSTAIRKYEVMKGVMPTGDSTPDLRNALAQDLKLARQYA